MNYLIKLKQNDGLAQNKVKAKKKKTAPGLNVKK